MLGIILNTTLNSIAAFKIRRRMIVRTPYGVPSSPMFFGDIGDHPALILYRHGIANINADHDVNHRANIHALKEAGATSLISFVNATDFSGKVEKADLALPYDLLDYTSGQGNTYIGTDDDNVTNHPDFSVPYNAKLRKAIKELAKISSTPIRDDVILSCLTGPRTPTNQELRKFLADGGDVYCMSGMPEAILAREKGLACQHVALITANRRHDPDFLKKMDSGEAQADMDKLNNLDKEEREELFRNIYKKVDAIFDALARENSPLFDFSDIRS